jgi:pimeloyl-ACP methyl ester carboxylesterase
MLVKFLKTAVLIAGAAFVVVLLIVGALFAYRAHLQKRNAQLFAIRTPNGIEESGYVRIGGIEQWIQIRGNDRNNPVILCLNGGPGASWVPLTGLFLPWERYFTVVQWDQRGEGKTLESTGLGIASTMSVNRMTADGLQVAQYVRARLHKPKIILLGHSWGSILGIHMLKARPDLFSAYVGTGQVGNLPDSLRISYYNVLAQARKSNDSRQLSNLQRIGAPPYDDAHIQNYGILMGALNEYAPSSDRAVFGTLGNTLLTAPDYSFRDLYYRNLGFTAATPPALFKEMFSTNLDELGMSFSVPIYLLQGTQDNITVMSSTRAYYDAIRAPHKEFVGLEGGGHFAVWSMPNRFLMELRRLGVGRRTAST